MFLGHFGVAFGVKKFTPAVSLGTLFFATLFMDLLMNTLMLVGIEEVKIRPVVESYNIIDPASLHATVSNTKITYPLEFNFIPFSHSLLMAVVFAAVIGGMLYLYGHKTLSCLIVAGVALSHWVLDVLVHYPDLPLYPASNPPKIGFALWEATDITLFLEVALFLTGIALYMRYSYAKSKNGKYGIWLLAALIAGYHFLFVYKMDLPNVYVLAIVGELPWLFVLMAYWVSKKRGNLKRID